MKYTVEVYETVSILKKYTVMADSPGDVFDEVHENRIVSKEAISGEAPISREIIYSSLRQVTE